VVNSRRLLVTALATVALAATPSVAFAKGGTGGGGGGGGSTLLTTVAAPCPADGTGDYFSPEGAWYALTDANFPGGVAVNIVIPSSNIPFAKAVCLSPGWAADYGTTSKGFTVGFTYNGERAIDFRFEAGRTEVRNY
jgi:hypothetical protein